MSNYHTEIFDALIKECRGHCCLCRQKLLPGSVPESFIAALPERHIVCFSDQFSHSVNDFALLCIECRQSIQIDDIEHVKQKKKHWIEIASAVENELLYKGKPPDIPENELLTLKRITVTIEEYALAFSLIVPDLITIELLIDFMKDALITPIYRFDQIKRIPNSSEITLSHKEYPEETFESDTILRDIDMEVTDSYLVQIQSTSMHPYDLQTIDLPFHLSIQPRKPFAREAYFIKLSPKSSHPNSALKHLIHSITVSGTDGYSDIYQHHWNVENINLKVPGAAEGVKDTITIRIQRPFPQINLSVLFDTFQNKPISNTTQSVPREAIIVADTLYDLVETLSTKAGLVNEYDEGPVENKYLDFGEFLLGIRYSSHVSRSMHLVFPEYKLSFWFELRGWVSIKKYSGDGYFFFKDYDEEDVYYHVIDGRIPGSNFLERYEKDIDFFMHIGRKITKLVENVIPNMKDGIS